MDKKNLMFQATQPINKLTIEDLPSELAELSEEDLSQVKGGVCPASVV
jgi:bacteriocin leader peptide (microcyclamide/patellamide family)